MKVTARIWVILLFAVLLIAAGVLYWMYDHRLEEREQALASKQLAELMIPSLQSQKVNAESELAGLKAEYEELLETIDGLKITLNLAQEDLLNSQSQLVVAIESIEYGEMLFSLAGGTEVGIEKMTFENPVFRNIEGITYEVYRFDLGLKATNDKILAFIDSLVAEETFKTTVIKPVNMVIPTLVEPQPYDVEAIREKHYQALLEQNQSEVTNEMIIEVTLDAVRSLFNQELIPNAVQERIDFIEAEISGIINAELTSLIAEGIAEYTQQQIAALLADKVAEYWGARIINMMPEDIEDLLGYDMALWVGDEIEAGIPGQIRAFVSNYLNTAIEQEINGLVEPSAAAVEALVEAEVEELERLAAAIPIPDSTVNITLEIFSYPGY